MNSKGIIGTVTGLIVGLAVGFGVANFLNRSASESPAEPAAIPAAPADSGIVKPPADQAGMIADVQTTLDEAKSNPKSPDAQIKAGDLYLKIQRFDEALKFYTLAAELEPENFEANANIGQIHFKRKEYEKAGEFYAKALAVNKSDPGLHNDLGLTFYLKEPADPKRAIEEYRLALELDPEHEFALQNMSVALRDIGRVDELKMTLTRLKKVNPNNTALKSLSGN